MRSRQGFALAAALMSLVLIGVLVTGALFAASQESHATETELLETRATGYAERAALDAIDNWTPGSCDSLTPGAVIIKSSPAEPPFESTIYITRLDSAVFQVVGEGRIASGGAPRIRRRIAIAVRSVRDSTGTQRVLRVSEQAWTALYQM